MRIVQSLCLATLFATPLLAAPAPIAPIASTEGSPLIDYDGFSRLTAEVRDHRRQRLIKMPDFSKMAKQKGTLILDARSARAFAAGHIKGAVNLPLPDFTAESLAQVIGRNVDRPILIYCNNNFRDNVFPVVTKSIQLALNIQTFVNLYGYGYKNVWELGEAIKIADLGKHWVKSKSAQIVFK